MRLIPKNFKVRRRMLMCSANYYCSRFLNAWMMEPWRPAGYR